MIEAFLKFQSKIRFILATSTHAHLCASPYYIDFMILLAQSSALTDLCQHFFENHTDSFVIFCGSFTQIFDDDD